MPDGFAPAGVADHYDIFSPLNKFTGGQLPDHRFLQGDQSLDIKSIQTFVQRKPGLANSAVLLILFSLADLTLQYFAEEGFIPESIFLGLTDNIVNLR